MKTRLAVLCLLILAMATLGWAEQRFPPPDFESGYTQPPLTFQEVREGYRAYLDVAVLLAALSLAAWLLHKKRSRTGILLLGIGSLLYLGFYKEGCVCPIGAIQNIALGVVDPNFPVSLPVIAFFVLPLVFALVWGRVFCGGVCPLGAIQDLFLFRPIRVPAWLESPLGLFRYFYLGLAVYFVLVHNRFVICEYDPFVSLFRFNGPFWRLAMGAGFLLVGLFIARPYCRYLCPYGALLSWFSRWSSVPVRITPQECINCTLCDATCPFEAIHRPKPRTTAGPGYQLILLATALLVVVLLGVGGYLALGGSLAGMLLGLWFGLAIAAKVLKLIYSPRREKFETDSGSCLSCARCYESCPHERARWEEEVSHAAH